MTLLLSFAVSPPAFAASPAELVSQFRAQHGEGKVTVDAGLTEVAREQAVAMAAKDELSHEVAGPFTRRIAKAKVGSAGENIAYGYTDFPRTLNQWINSPPHRRNLLLHGASLFGVASAHSASGKTYWAMAIGAPEDKPKREKKPARVAGHGAAATHTAKREAPAARPAPKRDCTIRMLGMCI
ncbi:CAP domain-containing protein [Rhodopseudomonas sp. B29]|uniref:CAP domain-containing protein n=1 Tax=Rhodopseudomonas sp. B29 TaxID=95607 RepID=UPI00034D0E8A|nr:CAP domain-containing protein [Rhodopseudomonas sp. B29]